MKIYSIVEPTFRIAPEKIRFPGDMKHTRMLLATNKTTNQTLWMVEGDQIGIDEFLDDFENPEVVNLADLSRSEWSMNVFPDLDDGILDFEEVVAKGFLRMQQSQNDRDYLKSAGERLQQMQQKETEEIQIQSDAMYSQNIIQNG